MDDETRKESSVPVASRISVVDLAKMDWHWLKVERVNIKTMSQLVSWTFTALVDILESNEKMPENTVKDVLSAHKYLESRGLYQRSLKKRSDAKIVAALGFENLRKQGVDPAMYGSPIYKVMHSKHSIDVVDRQIDHGGKYSTTDAEWDEMQERIAEEKKKEVEELTKETLKNARASGMIVDVVDDAKKTIAEGEGLRREGGKECDKWEEDILKRDEKRRALENAPLKPEDFNLVKE